MTKEHYSALESAQQAAFSSLLEESIHSLIHSFLRPSEKWLLKCLLCAWHRANKTWWWKQIETLLALVSFMFWRNWQIMDKRTKKNNYRLWRHCKRHDQGDMTESKWEWERAGVLQTGQGASKASPGWRHRVSVLRNEKAAAEAVGELFPELWEAWVSVGSAFPGRSRLFLQVSQPL